MANLPRMLDGLESLPSRDRGLKLFIEEEEIQKNENKKAPPRGRGLRTNPIDDSF